MERAEIRPRFRQYSFLTFLPVSKRQTFATRCSYSRPCGGHSSIGRTPDFGSGCTGSSPVAHPKLLKDRYCLALSLYTRGWFQWEGGFALWANFGLPSRAFARHPFVLAPVTTIPFLPDGNHCHKPTIPR